MKLKKYLCIATAALACTSCELLQPDEIINPNVSEETFLETPITDLWNWDVGAEFRISIKKPELRGLRP